MAIDSMCSEEDLDVSLSRLKLMSDKTLQKKEGNVRQDKIVLVYRILNLDKNQKLPDELTWDQTSFLLLRQAHEFLYQRIPFCLIEKFYLFLMCGGLVQQNRRPCRGLGLFVVLLNEIIKFIRRV